GPAGLSMQVQYTDPLGGAHYWNAPIVPVTINVTSLPLTLTADPTSGPTPLNTTFSLSSSDPDAGTVDYRLDFGDGQSTPGTITPPYNIVSIPHTYSASGVYQAIATVSNAGGSASTTSVNIAGTSTAPPSNTSLPQIDGTAQQGVTLTEIHGG